LHLIRLLGAAAIVGSTLRVKERLISGSEGALKHNLTAGILYFKRTLANEHGA
jgi:hypothetical protein